MKVEITEQYGSYRHKCRALKCGRMQILPFILQKENVIKVKFYTIDIDYIKYLYSYDSEVYLNKQCHDYENKPYVGIIIYNNSIPYFVPLTSAKPKHLKLKNNGADYLVIYENINKTEVHKLDIIKDIGNGEIKKLLSVIDLKKAIPVANNCYHEIDIRNHKDRDLLAKEYEFCKRKKKTIFDKTISIINYQKKTNIIKFAYCNFNLLEEKMNEWNDTY